MSLKPLETVEAFKHGDIVRVVFHEENCGIDKGKFKAIVVDSKEDGLIVIPEKFEAHVFSAVEKGAYWEIGVEWLLENDVEVYLLYRFTQLIKERWGSPTK
ncbi:conjugal transfer protein TraF [Enterococcus gallinarum]|uniref:conjugal transfer protein TraF n=1 Tax=Enterococcus gallinarum TaxID=1353 RepID=UPI00288CAB8F|nr:conjugal transfer protein TraF [Enterococcus gallinarum]MDT2680035.1 conjugal transfer protein TraF [Enterococcus gallinarum]MDT2684670.1 conjugal transfer protein TraF [Enterococcus gallinarum]